MNVLLVYRGRYHIREALDLETLAVVLREGGHEVSLVYDPDTFGVTDNVLQAPALAKLLTDDGKTASRIAESDPDAVIFSVLPGTYAWSREIAGAMKRRASAPVVFIGLHPSLVPQRVIRDECVDYAVSGEVENVINPLLEAIGAGREPSDVGNLWYRRNGRAIHTPRAELVDLDALPLPDKGLFAPFVSHRYSYSAMVSRGCPFQCTFCEETCVKKLYGAKYFRRKSAATVMRELAAGKKRYNYREVIFKDSYLSGDKRWLRELMQRYRREIRAPFKCFCTIAGFDEETARLLKESGCYSVEFGLQTWNDRVRREILNRRETNQDALRAFGYCDKHHLWYDVDHMFNLPNETQADHHRGAVCYHRLRYLSRVKVHFLVYLPTADIVEHAQAVGDLPPDVHERLEEGMESDFYDQAHAPGVESTILTGYAALYKILPMLPGWLLRWFLRGGRVAGLRRIPSAMMALLQGLNALRCGDLRFLAYLQTYPVKILRSLVRRIESTPGAGESDLRKRVVPAANI